MRIGVIGAGAVGSLLAGRLTLAGHEVQVISRGVQRDTLAAHGISMRGGYGEAIARLQVVDRLADVELCLVCTKAHDVAEALSAYAGDLAPGTPVVLAQNGVEAFRIASQYLPTEQLFGLITLIAVNFTEPGVITVTNPQPTFIGRGHGPADDDSPAIAAIINQAVPTEAIDNFEGALWTKLVLNMVNALPAITGMPVQQVVQHRFLLKAMTASMREAAQVGLAAKIPFAKLHALDETVVLRLARQPLWLSKRIPLGIARGMGPVPNLASMLQSIRRGQPTEIEFLNGAIVRTAEGLGLDAPINRALTALVHEVEASGAHLNPTQVARALSRHGVRL